MVGLELTWKANIEARTERIARLWEVWSLPGKRISKHVPNGLLGYGGLELTWKVTNLVGAPRA